MTFIEYECWRYHLIWDAEMQSGVKAGPKFIGDPKIYERWRKKVGSGASLNAQVHAAVWERNQEKRKEGGRRR